MAGTSTAYALAKRGFRVKIFEKHSNIASEASGNKAGILHPLLTKNIDNRVKFYLAGFEFSRKLIVELQQNSAHKISGEFCGAFQQTKDNDDANRLKSIAEKLAGSGDIDLEYLNKKKAEELLGFRVQSGGLYLPQSGWINVGEFCHVMAAHKNIEIITNHNITSLEQDNNGLWQLKNNGKTIAESQIVVIANAYAACNFSECRYLPIKQIYGQLTHLKTNESLAQLKHILCYGGYITPAQSSEHVVGATYRNGSSEQNLLQIDQDGNLQNLADNFPNLMNKSAINEVPLRGKASPRAISGDYVPIIGELSHMENMMKYGYIYGKEYLLYDKNTHDDSLQYKGLCVNLAHASRGIISAPIAGEIIACKIAGEPLPLNESILSTLHSNRFVFRNMRESN